jgi:hypothetical protein
MDNNNNDTNDTTQKKILKEIDSILCGRLRETQLNLESRIKQLVRAQQVTNVVLVVGFITTTLLLLRR